MWKSIEATFKEMQSHAEIVESIQKDFKRLDWDSLEVKYGEEKVNEMRHNYNNYLENDLPDVNIEEIESQFKSIFNPVFDKMKDMFFDSLPDIEKRFKQNNYILPLMKLDSYGLPAYDFLEDYQILDNYFPAYRDKIIEEIENDDYDFDAPKGTPTIDDVAAALHYDVVVERETNIFKNFEESNNLSVGLSAKKEETEIKLRKLKQIIEEKRLIETEVGLLRSRVDAAKESVEDGVTDETENKFNLIEYLYDFAESQGVSKEMCDPMFLKKFPVEVRNEMKKKS